jgi:hypothetical protein
MEVGSIIDMAMLLQDQATAILTADRTTIITDHTIITETTIIIEAMVITETTGITITAHILMGDTTIIHMEMETTAEVAIIEGKICYSR